MSSDRMGDAAATTSVAAPVVARSIGERVRSLRVAAGLTQTALAGDRFSKEYVSQIERGKTRPTDETVAWLAERLAVDAQFLLHGVSADDRTRVEALLTRAEALAAAGTPVGRYFLQASIAAQHARAARAEETNWRRIAALYDVLARAAPGPVVE
ncbi:MAG TPA: helix-turn-helix domain-containing protein, partial [Gaiella sp.]|nr:helix-turn-helix domain-containing protein [Gaiella sp.]